MILLLVVLVFTMTACETSTEVSSEVGSAGTESAEDIENTTAPDEEDLVNDSVEEDISETMSEAASEEETGNAGTSEEISTSEETNASEETSASEETTTSEEANTSEENGTSEETSTSEEESVSEEPEFTVQEHSAVLFVKKAVNVRKGPSTDYEKIGGLNKGEQIEITGIADTGWYQIQYNGTTAYVASSYLIDEASYQAMIAEEEAAALAAQQAAEQAAQQQAAAEQAAQQQAAEQAAQQQAVQQQAQGDYRAQVVALMNQERANAGIGGISQNAALDAAAQIRAQEIVSTFSHSRPNGTSCFTVLDESGIVYMAAGENIAAGYGTPAEVMTGWMNSEGHRANILNGSFGQVGIGYYTDPNTPYGTYWVQIFTN